MTTAKLKPREATPPLVIRDPVTKRKLSQDGDVLELTNFWRRRIDDGDVLIVE